MCTFNIHCAMTGKFVAGPFHTCDQCPQFMTDAFKIVMTFVDFGPKFGTFTF